VSLDVSAIPARPAGAGRYALALARVLHGREDVDLQVVARRGDGSRWTEGARPGARPPAEAAPRPRPARLVWEQVGLPRVLRRSGVAVHHGPHYTMPERAPVPCVVTVHDCTFFDHPALHERSKVLLFRRAITVAARRAAAVVCVSRTTAERLTQLVEVRVPLVVAPHGVDHARFSPAEPAPGADRAALQAAGLDPGRPFVAFVGTLEPRKGVGHLVRAFDRLDDAAGTDLVIAGQRGWGPDEVGPARAAARHPERIRTLGYLPDDVVPALYRQAACVCYPATEEGFGLPALEALACGAPLVTTEGTAMAEFAAGAALLVPAGDETALAGALEAALSEVPGATAPALRRTRGLAVAAAHTWEASAEIHLAAYRAAAGS
jgi:glycosyltransferase involved in cell wall biosynthesis